MKYLKIIGLAALAAMALTAFLGAGTASASNLRIFGSGTNLKVGTTIEASLEKGTSAFLEDAFGLTAVTCTGSNVHGVIERTTQEPVGKTGQPKGKISAGGLTFTPCGHTVDVEANGELEIRNIAGTTNGTVFSSGAKVKVFNTLLNQNCIANTGAGTDIGTLTGAKSAITNATMDINGLIPLEGCSASNARWTGSYEVTKPVGLVSEA
jgi:hypothetical protein